MIKLDGGFQNRQAGAERLWNEIYREYGVTDENELLERFSISEYAVEKQKHEWFAEMFTAIIDGQNNPEYVRILDAIIRRRIGG